MPGFSLVFYVRLLLLSAVMPLSCVIPVVTRIAYSTEVGEERPLQRMNSPDVMGGAGGVAWESGSESVL